MNVSGIFSKIDQNLDKAALAALIYTRYKEEGVTDPIAMATSWLQNIPNELAYTMQDPFNRIKYKLVDAPHAWTGAIKLGALMYAAGWAGLINAKWKKRGENIVKGAAVAALTLPGPHSVRDGNFQNALKIGAYDY